MTTVKCDDSAPVNAALGQQHCLISVIAGESIFVSGIVGPDILATHWRWGCVSRGEAGAAASETQKTSEQTQCNGKSRRGKPWRLLREWV
jgi:hypothetical protein